MKRRTLTLFALLCLAASTAVLVRAAGTGFSDVPEHAAYAGAAVDWTRANQIMDGRGGRPLRAQ